MGASGAGQFFNIVCDLENVACFSGQSQHRIRNSSVESVVPIGIRRRACQHEEFDVCVVHIVHRLGDSTDHIGHIAQIGLKLNDVALFAGLQVDGILHPIPVQIADLPIVPIGELEVICFLERHRGTRFTAQLAVQLHAQLPGHIGPLQGRLAIL